jgi:hypothetical protein
LPLEAGKDALGLQLKCPDAKQISRQEQVFVVAKLFKFPRLLLIEIHQCKVILTSLLRFIFRINVQGKPGFISRPRTVPDNIIIILLKGILTDHSRTLSPTVSAMT